MATKMTMFWNQSSAGFSETWYHPSVTPKVLADTLPNSFWTKAAALHDETTVLRGVRFSSTVPPKQSYLMIPYPPRRGARTGSTADPGPDVVSTTIVYRILSATGQSRRVWFRGLADSDTFRTTILGTDLLNPQIENAIEGWMKALRSEGFAIRFAVLPPNGGLLWLKVAEVHHLTGQSANRASLRMGAGVLDPTVGIPYYFNGSQSDLPRFPRKAEILAQQVLGGVTYSEIAYQLPGGETVSPKNLRMAPTVNATSVIDSWDFERYGEHKTGRPFGMLRGRARGVAVLR